MHRWLGGVAGAVLLWILAACGGGGGGGGGTRSISGAVSGAVASGVTVKLSGAASATTTTDSSGDYGFGSLADGAYTVTAVRSGYVFGPASRSVTVSGADVTAEDFSAANLHDDFSASGLLASKWSSGQRQAALGGGSLLLSHSMQGLTASTSHTTAIEPIAGGEVTTWQADVKLTQADYSGDTVDRAGIDLWFQPGANRLAAPDDQNGSLFVRIALSNSASGLVAQRQLFECTSADCSTSTSVGTATGTWSGSTPPAIALDTTYTLSISVNTASKVVTYSLSGGAYSTALAASIDAHAVTTPFAVDLSAANQYRARLFAYVRGQATGGGAGAVTAEFDNVRAGVGGASATLFDDFSGTSLDNTRWNHGCEDVRLVAGGVQAQLAQARLGYRVGMDVADLGASAGLQAGVRVTALTQTGGGRVAARLAGTLYNDGTNGSGAAPDTSGASSEVGDVVAILSMTDTDVSYAVVRCDSALCSQGGVTFVKDYTPIGTVTPGTDHTLGWWWDPATHTVRFQLDGAAPVAFDPTTAGSGFPVVGSAQIPFRQIGVTAADTAATAFDAGASGSVTAIFSEVGTF
jgi:hypothetical protein